MRYICLGHSGGGELKVIVMSNAVGAEFVAGIFIASERKDEVWVQSLRSSIDIDFVGAVKKRKCRKRK